MIKALLIFDNRLFFTRAKDGGLVVENDAFVILP